MAKVGPENLQFIVLAAGKGTRMRSSLPKVLHPVCGQSLLERTIRACAECGPSKVVVVIGHGEALVRQELEEISKNNNFQEGFLDVCVQSEQNGTGHAVQLAIEHIDENCSDVLITSGDTPLIEGKTFLELIENSGSDNTLSVLSFAPEDPHGFGRICRNDAGEVCAIVEEKDCTAEQKEISEVNSSIYLAKREFLKNVLPKLQPNNAQGELYLTDIVSLGIEAGVSVRGVCSKDADSVAGANTRAELAELEAERRKRINTAHMDAGVTLRDPATTYIDEDVEIGPDTVIGPGVLLSGKTKVGQNVTIEAHSELRNAIVSDGVHIRLSCRIYDSEVGESSALGPFAHLRPGSKLSKDVRIGNFVETKKATLDKGAKVNHLSYVGDASVGADANLGAGTITCNYDGYKKSITEIGEGAFVGSNSALIAPVKIGKGAVVAAGSSISKNVPDDALGIVRAEQREISDWAKKRREKQNLK